MPSTSSTIASFLAADRASGMILGRTTMERQQLLYNSLPSTSTTTISPFDSISTTVSQQHFSASREQLIMQEAGELSRPDLPATSLYSFEELGHWTSDTKVTALIHALLASFSLILVSELGDKTFIITAIMAMKNSRSLVFISSASALFVMTVLSVGMGVAVTVIPELYTHYASIVLFLCFGLKMLKESWDMTSNNDEVSEFEEVKRSLEDDESDEVKRRPPELAHQQEGAPISSAESANGAEEVGSGPLFSRAEKWYSKLVETLYIAPIVIKVFTMIFVAEWGDRSQISTVILAAREDLAGVFIGSLGGHLFCTGLAVIGGRFVADMISVRTMTLLGAVIFLFFAVFAILTGPGMS